ncbi:VENN motif pre-toxin domain-containing protein, partial [Lelliottia sp. RWM.1]|uniref:VENN motif pre-toxin domain-containing protein n=1 Tax=Lelliottia sp. RWM.1 TaxID=2663242 RepID=UPI00193D45F4
VSSLVTIAGGLAGAGVSGGNLSMAALASNTARVEVENNALSDKDKKLPIIDIRPGWLKPGVLDEDGDLLGAGGGIAKGGKSKDTQIWTETKKAEPVGNDYGHWTKHGKEFPEYQNAKQYVDASHNFVTNPPAGTLTTTRKNGDTIYYNPSSNTFAVKNSDGVPKTMFRPDPADHGYPTNLDYFNAQK